MHVQSNAGARQTHETDGAIWEAFVAEPRAGLELLYDCYSGLVYGLARAILANAQDAEDLTSDVFMSLLTRCTYDPARGSLAGYLGAMTRSRALDRLRARRRMLRLVDDGARYDAETEAGTILPLDEASMDESAKALRRALAALPATQRRALELSYFRGLTQAEIAVQLDAPLGTVKGWVRQGLYGLRDALLKFQE